MTTTEITKNTTNTLDKHTSSSEEGDQISERQLSSKNILDIKPDLLTKLVEIPEAMDYINKLHKLIKKYLKRIKALKDKLRKDGLQNACVQTDSEFIASNQTSVDSEEQKEPKSLADDIKQAAESAMQNMGFVYEETSGLYYDYNTGYYYNAEYGLYYDGKSGTYMKYNPDTQIYEFHSQVSVTQSSHAKDKEMPRKRKSKHSTKDTKRPRGVNLKKSTENEVEEGECSESNDEVSTNDEGTNSDTSESSKQWPPCMRIILESSENPNMKIGSLYIITCDGGTLGREGKHSITLTDTSTSKHHLKFIFDKESDCYQVIDLGSRNGTLLNGKRMSSSKQESEPMQITHGSKIQIGSTVLLCHIHPGSQTCGHCEPGLLVSKGVEKDSMKPSKIKNYKNELKNLKKMYGVNYEPDSTLAEGYIDRAQRRRKTVGSQNPHEKTQIMSLDESIAKENKGFKMLAKMGWKEGQSLGKDGGGLLEPIKVEGNKGLAGIGCEELVKEVLPTEKQNVWKKTQERFDKLPDKQDAFVDQN